ncbi:hypothetical protein MC7420_3667 [Coleofasciculus chthonoplastes PCC 7420]|uniref:Uncharacterized protein n=1 Tax=Coleofasciculus chthonoplastes PCC 7420 TaxID=118168 RepID=B4VX24_9CYAN|nr:4-Cys prefix domain-containing protein [Coleofasciculus chthonoplastes]EDX73493.1 hypothetical protein MC7420_3667 [Coleofasciculus chthonoplastes PCC 7420]
MSLCINPKCQNSDNPDNLLYCQSCQSELLLEGRYRVISLLVESVTDNKVRSRSRSVSAAHKRVR